MGGRGGISPPFLLAAISRPVPGSKSLDGQRMPLPRVPETVFRLRKFVTTPLGESVIVGLGLVLAYLFLRLPEPVVAGAFDDDAVYLALGKALASGEGYRSVYAAGAPVHVKYPPAVPVLYAALWWIGGTLTNVARLVWALNLVACGTAAAMLWRLARTRLNIHPLVAVPCVLGPFLLEGALHYYHLALTEPYFVLGWSAVLWWYYRTCEVAPARRTAAAIALGTAIALTTLVRTQAVFFLAAVLLALVLDRVSRRAVTACALAATIPLIIWWALQAHWIALGPVSTQPDEASYLSWIPWSSANRWIEFLREVGTTNWTRYWQSIPAFFSGIRWLALALSTLFALGVVAGGLLVWKRHRALVLTVALTALVILCWPFTQDRLVATALPFAGLLLGVTVHRALTVPASRVRVGAGVVFALSVLTVTLRQPSIRQHAGATESPQASVGFNYPGYFLIANSRFLETIAPWIEAHTAPADRILIERGPGVYLHTGRQTVSPTAGDGAVGAGTFGRPGSFVAARILADSVTVVGVGDLSGPMVVEIAALFEACRGVLDYMGAARGASVAVFYRVVPDEVCLDKIAALPGPDVLTPSGALPPLTLLPQ